MIVFKVDLPLLNPFFIFFQYIEDKDVFETHYSRMFANRLIKGTSGSDDAEESILQKLNG